MFFCVRYCSGAVKKYPKNSMLGRRQVTDGKVKSNLERDESLVLTTQSCSDLIPGDKIPFYQADEYVWQTYEEVYQKVLKVGSAIRRFGVKPVRN
jgi:long-chain acyl-CoA synthetase